jgi:hypothetical protein
MKKVGWSSILVAAALITFAVITEAQQPAKVPSIGYLSAPPLSASASRKEAFRQGLRELGYVEGKTLSSSGDLPRENPSVFPRSRLSSCVSR